MESSSLPFASLENEDLRVDYLTTLGPRIIGLQAKKAGLELLARTPDVHWPTPHGDYYLHGGHRLWVAPEDPFFTCPEDHVHAVAGKDEVLLQSSIDASGLEKEISVHLNENCVELRHRVTWHGKEPLALAPWAITQLRLGGMAILPQPASEGLLPNRNIVLWSYSRLRDERLDLQDDLILLHGRAAEEAFKIGHYNSHGWIAYALENVLFIKHFSVDQPDTYPDMGANAQAYVRDSCVELETLGALKTLAPQEFVVHQETWEILTGGDTTTLEQARKISRQLSQK